MSTKIKKVLISMSYYRKPRAVGRSLDCIMTANNIWMLFWMCVCMCVCLCVPVCVCMCVLCWPSISFLAGWMEAIPLIRTKDCVGGVVKVCVFLLYLYLFTVLFLFVDLCVPVCFFVCICAYLTDRVCVCVYCMHEHASLYDSSVTELNLRMHYVGVWGKKRFEREKHMYNS